MADTTLVLSIRSSSFSVLGRSGIEYVRTVLLTDDFSTSSVWYDQCMLRYSNINFFGVAQTGPAMFRWSIRNITSPEETDFEVLALMNDLVDETLGTNKLYRDGNRTKINGNGIMRYGLEQSTRDLNHTECNNCLKILVNNVSDCCQSSSGFRMFNPSCDLRYEIYSFFEPELPPPMPPPSSQPMPPLQSLLPRSGNAKIVDFFFHPQKKKAWQFYLNILALLKFRQTKEYVTVSIFLQWNF